MKNKIILPLLAVLLLCSASSFAQTNPRILTSNIVEVTDGQVVIKLRADGSQRTLSVDPTKLEVRFKSGGEVESGTFADLRPGMLCNVRIDAPEGSIAQAFVVNGTKPTDTVEPSPSATPTPAAPSAPQTPAPEQPAASTE